jgi:hypothetical protein
MSHRKRRVGMARGSKLSRVVEFFREEQIDVVRVTFNLIKEIVESRLGSKVEPIKRRKRGPNKPKVNATSHVTHDFSDSVGETDDPAA